MLPGTLIYTLAGRQLMIIESTRDLITWPIVVMLLILSVLSILPVFLKNNFYNNER